ncbi:hypothetical protein IMPJCBKJ_02832 [Pseudoalteromonas sp. MB47]|nr:hypothetical protein [Pseudoalteromonas sp. MB47]
MDRSNVHVFDARQSSSNTGEYQDEKIYIFIINTKLCHSSIC